ncbi:hypothetical protein GGI35DRAFT_463588 [Trichoderma velutinum]
MLVRTLNDDEAFDWHYFNAFIRLEVRALQSIMRTWTQNLQNTGFYIQDCLSDNYDAASMAKRLVQILRMLIRLPPPCDPRYSVLQNGWNVSILQQWARQAWAKTTPILHELFYIAIRESSFRCLYIFVHTSDMDGKSAWAAVSNHRNGRGLPAHSAATSLAPSVITTGIANTAASSTLAPYRVSAETANMSYLLCAEPGFDGKKGNEDNQCSKSAEKYFDHASQPTRRDEAMDLDDEYRLGRLGRADFERVRQATGIDQEKSSHASTRKKIPEFIEVLLSHAERAVAECSEREQKLNNPALIREKSKRNGDSHRVNMRYYSETRKETNIWAGIRGGLKEALEFREILRMVNIKRPLPPQEKWCGGAIRIQDIEWYKLFLEDIRAYLKLLLMSLKAPDKPAGSERCSVTITDSQNVSPKDVRQLLKCLTRLREHLVKLIAFISTYVLASRIKRRKSRRKRRNDGV